MRRPLLFRVLSEEEKEKEKISMSNRAAIFDTLETNGRLCLRQHLSRPLGASLFLISVYFAAECS